MDSTRTLLFTDIQGSTYLWEQHPQAMSTALAYHDSMMAQTVEAYHGKIFKNLGDGICAIFDSPADALQASLRIQQQIHEAATRAESPILALGVRVGLYTGPVEERGNDYFGTTLNRASRLMNAAHGGQILFSESTKSLLPAETELRDLGIHRLRDVNEPEHIYQAISSDFPLNAKPIRSLTPRPTNLPAQLTSFVGREEHVHEICQRLRQPNVRLLTLLGPGGIGKTRLSMQVGTNLLDEYEDGVFFIPLAPLSQTDAVAKAIAQALKIEEVPKTPLLETLKAAIQPRQMLLIFDNFEHILDAAPLVNDLLSAGARVKALATSRESLFIYGERTYTVPPLKLPQPGDSPDQLAQSAAAKLFIERIQEMQPEFVLSENSAQDVVTICRHLDGLPLALELAAARVRDLTLHEIAEQIGNRLGLLNQGPRDLPSRQQTMRGAISWSYHLLSSDEQRAFARLAIFEGSFYAAAAETVTGIPDLTSFKSKGLIQQLPNSVFSMLGVIREYAMEKLGEFNEVASMREKHGLYYRDWLETAEAHMTGRDQIEWYNRLSVEQFNLQAALDEFLKQNAFENAGRMVGIMWRYWATQSLLSEGEQPINDVLMHADQLSKLSYAKVTQGAGRLALVRHQLARSIALQQISLGLYQSLDDKPGQAAMMLSLGETEYAQENSIQAENYLGAGLALFREVDDEAGVGRCLRNLGKIAMQSGDFAKAEPYLRESLTLAREHGSAEGLALTLYDLAGVLRTQGKYAEAEVCCRESLALYRELNFTIGIALMLYNIGYALQGQGNHVAAMEQFVEALKLLQPLEETNAISECLVGVAGAFWEDGQRDLSVKTLSAAKALLASMNVDRPLDYADQALYDRVYSTAKAGMDQSAWDTAWTAGQSVALDKLIPEILNAAKVQKSIL